jgi:hypothetical protein
VSSKSTRDKPASLGTLLATSREAAARLAGTAIDREQWRRVVGERIAARTEPGPKRGRELTVFVASASWAQELSLLVNEIVLRLKAARVYVDTVRFRVREIAPPLRDPAAPKRASRKAALPTGLLVQLERIADRELRDATKRPRMPPRAELLLQRRQALEALEPLNRETLIRTVHRRLLV